MKIKTIAAAAVLAASLALGACGKFFRRIRERGGIF